MTYLALKGKPMTITVTETQQKLRNGQHGKGRIT